MPAGRPKSDKTIIKQLIEANKQLREQIKQTEDQLLAQNAELQRSVSSAVTETHKAQHEVAELRSKFCDFYFLLGEIDNEYPKMDESIMLSMIRMMRDVADLESSR